MVHHYAKVSVGRRSFDSNRAGASKVANVNVVKEDPKNPHYQEQLKRFQDLAAKQAGGTKQGGK